MGKLTLLALTLASMVLSCAASGFKSEKEKYAQKLKWFESYKKYMTPGERETHQREIDALKPKKTKTPAEDFRDFIKQRVQLAYQTCDEGLALVRAAKKAPEGSWQQKLEESRRLGQRFHEDLEQGVEDIVEKGVKVREDTVAKALSQAPKFTGTHYKPRNLEAQRARWRTYRPASYQPPSKALLDAFNAKCAVTRAAIRKFAAQREEAAAKGPPKAPTPDAGPQPPAPPAPDAEDTSDDAKETTG